MKQNDYLYQLNFVKSQALRILEMQDKNKSALTYGCFHYPYWRDKTSEFPDTRFQEASATLLLLSHASIYDFESIQIEKSRLIEAFEAGVYAWGNQQNLDGSFDEWYKHEHGFAATCFSLIAMGLAIDFCKDQISQSAFENYRAIALKAGRWLLKNDDLVKYNHQAAGAAALAITWKVLGEDSFNVGARKKIDDVLRGQKSEGWFPEISGMDLGYCSVLLDYVMIYGHFTGDQVALEPMKKLMQFVSSLLLPNLTIVAECGLCLNPYVSRIGLLLLAKYDENAKLLSDQFFEYSPEWEGLSPTLSDDLRIVRWSHLPVFAYLILKEEFSSKRVGENVPSLVAKQDEESTIVYKESGIVRIKSGNFFLLILPCAGGLISGFIHKNNKWEPFFEHGFDYFKNGQLYYHLGYNNEQDFEVEGHQLKMTVRFSPAKFVFPGLVLRLGLRVVGAIPGAPKYVRKLIDWYRKKNKTAINQSVAPVKNGSGGFCLEKTVSWTDEAIVIKESFVGKRQGYQESIRRRVSGQFVVTSKNDYDQELRLNF
ncbi:MAG: hypothetical protein IPK04_06525 [Bdellovibrionales bacterium]|nr:hypothetical protein [Bdellovibrionales bacterium]